MRLVCELINLQALSICRHLFDLTFVSSSRLYRYPFIMAFRVTVTSIGSHTIHSTLKASPKPSICIQCQISRFSTTPSQAGPNGDRNKKRGVSALRRTGPRYPSAVSREPLPRPVTDPERRSKIKVNEKHGLWQFFDKEKKAFEAPEVVAEHGEQHFGNTRVSKF